MSEHQHYVWEMQAQTAKETAETERKLEEHTVMFEMLKEWSAKPHAYSAKKELLERTLLFVEGWQ